MILQIQGKLMEIGKDDFRKLMMHEGWQVDGGTYATMRAIPDRRCPSSVYSTRKRAKKKAQKEQGGKDAF